MCKSFNQLKILILEGKDKEFISEFYKIQEVLTAEDIAELYSIGYANKILLFDYENYEADYIQFCRIGITEIMNFLSDYFVEPVDYQFLFMGDVSLYVYHKTDDSITWTMLEGSKKDLYKRGYRKKDIDLFISAFKLQYQKVRKLLEVGARPDIFISARESPAEVQHTQLGTTLISELDSLVHADMCTGEVDKYWYLGYHQPENLKYYETDLFSLFESASVQTMLNLVGNYYNLEIKKFRLWE